MGLFNFGGQGGLFGEGFADRLAIAGALVNGDYGAASQIKARQGRAQQEQAEAEAKRQAMMGAYQALRGRGIPEQEALAMAQDPGVVAEFIKGKHADKQFDAGGGSVYNPTDKSFMTAPRFDGDGNIYAPGNGMTAPQRLQQGTKAIPVQPGGQVTIVDSITGRPDSYGGGPQLPQLGGAVVKSKEEYDALPPGTPYTAPDGSRRVKPGGPTGLPQSGGFPPF